MLVGGSAALENAIRWIDYRQKYYAAIVRESRTDKRTLEEIRGIFTICGLLEEQLSLLKEARPGEVPRYDAFLAQVEQVKDALKKTEKKAKADIIAM